jgi:WD40 repeat protein
LGYWLIKKRAKSAVDDKKFNEHLHGYTDQYLISDILYCPGAGELNSIHLSKHNEIVVIWVNSVNHFNKKGVLLKRKIFPRIVFADYLHGYLLTCQAQAGENSLYSDYSLCDFEGKKLLGFKAGRHPLVIAVSPNGKFVTVDNKIYSAGRMTAIGTAKDGIKTATFTHDSKYLITGDLHGELAAYNTSGKALTSKNENLGFPLSHLAISKDSRYLIVAGDKNIVKLLQLKDFSQLITDDKIYNNDPILLQDDVGTINNIAIIQDEDKIICTGDNVLLINFKGELLAELPTNYNEIGALYQESSKTFFTYNNKGNILLWQKPSKDYIPALFSPLDLRLTELRDYTNENFTSQNVYPDLYSPPGLLSATLNYSGAISRYSGYNFNVAQKRIMENSLAEISRLFTKCFRASNLRFIRHSIKNVCTTATVSSKPIQ